MDDLQLGILVGAWNGEPHEHEFCTCPQFAHMEQFGGFVANEMVLTFDFAYC